MSAYRPGHDPYIDYAAAAHPEDHQQERVFVPHVQDIQHGGAHAQGLHEQHLGAHQHQQQQQHHQQQIPVYAEQHSMSHHQSPQYGPGQGMMGYGNPGQMGQSSGIKRPRPDDDLEDLGMNMPGQNMRPGEMGVMGQQMPPQPIMGVGYGQVQHFHTHPLPNQGHRSKMPRMSEGDSMAGPSGSAPSVVGLEGMPMPAARPRGPKLKFTPEDDSLLVDLKENKSLTWKQIAEFFPGRSSGTLQVRYCTKLKAKTTQWTDETVSCCILAFSRRFPLSYLTNALIAGPETSDGSSRLRAREMAHCGSESRHRLHSCSLQRESERAEWGRIIAFSVSSRSTFCWRHKLLASSLSEPLEVVHDSMSCTDTHYRHFHRTLTTSIYSWPWIHRQFSRRITSSGYSIALELSLRFSYR